MTNDPRRYWLEDAVTRRQVLRGALGGAVALGAGGVLLGCGGDDGGDGGGGTPATGTSTGAEKLRMGGTLRVGATGGGASDTIDAHKPVVDTDIMRCWNLYESLAVRDAGLLRAPDAAGRVDRGAQGREELGRPAEARPHLPQRQAGDRRRRHLLPAADHRPEGPEGRRGVAQLRRHQAAQEDGRPHGAHPAAVRQRGLPGRPRPVLQRASSRPTTTRRTRSARDRSSSAPSRPASRARSRSSPTTGRAASRTSTSSSSSTSRRTRRASTRCSAARSTRSTTCPPRRSRASGRTATSPC